MNATTAPLVHLVRAPRSAIVHISVHGELTLCRRTVADTWSSELIEPAGAQTTTTCAACRAGADLILMRARQLEQLPTAGNSCAHRSCRTTEPCRYGDPDAQEPVHPDPHADLPVDRTPLTLLVVPCSGAKLEQPAPARELYRGTLTTMGLAACSVVEGSAEYGTGHAGTRTLILSALHGLLDLDTVVAPYDVRMGASESISTAELANQLRATGATRLVALTPNAYTNALRAACELAGVELVAALEGCRGIGDQRGRLAQLRRSGGYGAEGAVWGLETRRMVQEHADALAEDRARTADAAQQLVHLLSDDLLDACDTAAPGGLKLAPFTTPDAITCPACLPLVDEQRRQVLERDHVLAAAEREERELAHAEALLEDAMHDAAVSAAQNLTPELLEQYADRPHPPQQPMPWQLRNRMQHQRTLQLVPPR